MKLKTTYEVTTFIVHGVGAPKLHHGDIDSATWDFATTWGRRNGVPLDFSTAVAHPDDGPSVSYGVFEGELSDGCRHRIVELQWADLSRVSAGFFGPILAFFRVVFGLKTIAAVTERSLGEKYRISSRLSQLIFKLLLGPVLAINLWMVIALLAVSVWPLRDAPASVTLIVVGVLAAVPSLFAHLRSISWVRYLLLAGVVAATVPHWTTFFRMEGITTDFMSHVFTFTILLNILWLIISLLLIVQVLFWISARWTAQAENRNSLDAQTFVTATALRAWSIGIPLLGWLALQLAAGVRGDVADTQVMCALDEIPVAAQMSCDLEVMKMVLIPTIGMNWLVLMIIALALIPTFFWFKRQTEFDPDSASRLIVGPVVKWTVILTTLFFSGLVIWFWYLVMSPVDWKSKLPHLINIQYEPWLEELYRWGWVIAAALGGLVILLREQVRMIFDFAIDAINYFSLEDRESEVTKNVLARFRAVVEHETAGSKGDILFVAHSQGSVLAAEYIHNYGCANARLVTVGSPISHIYGHYCANWFWPNGSPSAPIHLRDWVNLYRKSDYVGRKVEYAGENLPIGNGYHTGYFNDQKVHKLLEDRDWVPTNP